MKKSIKDLTDIQGKKALVRVDINVPLDADKMLLMIQEFKQYCQL